MTPLNAPDRYHLVIPVREEDIDRLGHVNNIVYLHWVQKIATAHWRVLAPQEAQQDVVWVVLRHEIDYKSAALPGDEVRVETWIGEATRLSFERHTQMFRVADGRLLAQARTLWCPVNPQTGRPQRVSAELRALFSTSSATE